VNKYDLHYDLQERDIIDVDDEAGSTDLTDLEMDMLHKRYKIVQRQEKMSDQKMVSLMRDVNLKHLVYERQGKWDYHPRRRKVLNTIEKNYKDRVNGHMEMDSKLEEMFADLRLIHSIKTA
jgi:hypothetical protein